jgi:hypothetical protein
MTAHRVATHPAGGSYSSTAHAATLRRLTLAERRAKELKDASGAHLVTFGVLFIVAPDVLRRRLAVTSARRRRRA